MKPVHIKTRVGTLRAEGPRAHIGEEPQDEGEKIMTSIERGIPPEDLKTGIARMLERRSARDVAKAQIARARAAGIASAKARLPAKPADDWWTKIASDVVTMRSAGRSDSDIATRLHRKANVAARTVRKRIRQELGARPKK
jgi:hypothetical protein